MLFDRRCPGCRRPAGALCHPCRAELVASRLPAGGIGPAPPPGVTGLTALFAYQGRVASLVLSAKNGGNRQLLRWFGSLLVVAITADTGRHRFDAVTWVPASRARRRRRGYDQGRELALAVAGGLGIGAVCPLQRSGREAQAGRSRHDRLLGPRLRAVGPVPARVLVVDDVTTTGASLTAAAAAVRSGGASEVAAAVVAAVVDDAAGPVRPGRDEGLFRAGGGAATFRPTELT